MGAKKDSMAGEIFLQYVGVVFLLLILAVPAAVLWKMRRDASKRSAGLDMLGRSLGFEKAGGERIEGTFMGERVYVEHAVSRTDEDEGSSARHYVGIGAGFDDPSEGKALRRAYFKLTKRFSLFSSCKWKGFEGSLKLKGKLKPEFDASDLEVLRDLVERKYFEQPASLTGRPRPWKGEARGKVEFVLPFRIVEDPDAVKGAARVVVKAARQMEALVGQQT